MDPSVAASGVPAVVFDLDGTLIDSAPDLQAVANILLSQEGRRPITLTEAHSFVGQGVKVFVRRMMVARDLDAESPDFQRLLAGFMERYEAAVNLTVLYPHVVTVLEQLRAQGVRLGLCTNKPLAPTRAVLRHFGLADFFAAVVGGDSLPVNKPDPATLRHCLDLMGERVCVYVGDSEVDAALAQNTGMPFAFFTRGYCHVPVEALPHSMSFDDFADLPRLLAQVELGSLSA